MGTETPRRHFCNDRSARNNPHPARGRKPIAQIVFFSHCVKQPTPRKGTETLDTGRPRIAYRRNNPHPQGDGNAGALGLFYCQPETTHTPQGDGNYHSPCTLQDIQPETTHTPQGDGNHCTTANISKSSETTHTPQGDGNCGLPITRHPLRETTHTPQGDGNAFRCFLLLSLPKQPTPRKGTENHLCLHCRNCWRNHSHPRQGTTDKKGV